jgi:hypothetical protein
VGRVDAYAHYFATIRLEIRVEYHKFSLLLSSSVVCGERKIKVNQGLECGCLSLAQYAHVVKGIDFR